MVRRAVFLDRDGVLNANVEREGRAVAPTTLAEFCIASDAADEVKRLKKMGFFVVVATNQPDVAKGRVKRSIVEAMNARLSEAVPVDVIKVCYHSDEDRCSCRKPLPGMLLEAAREYAIDLASSYMVGDRWRDVEAGRNAGCKTILLDGGVLQDSTMRPDCIVKSLREAVDCIFLDTRASGDKEIISQ